MVRKRSFVSRSYALLLGDAGRHLRRHTESSEVIVLAPTRATADDFVRQESGKGVIGVHRFTLPQFAAALAGPVAATRKLAPITQLSSEALAARIVHQLDREQKIAYFQPVAATPGFARALAATIIEIRLAGLHPNDLGKAGSPCADLAMLCTAYAHELAERSLADLPLLFEIAAEVAHSGSHPLLGLPVICLDLPISHKLEQDLLDSLSEVSEFRIGSTGKAGTAGLDRVREWIFSLAPPPASMPDGSVAFFSAAGEGLECVEIARRILALSREGVQFDSVAILLRDPERYQSRITEALRRTGIPAYFSKGATRPDPAGRAFLALLLCASEGCSASRFAEYLSLGQIPIAEKTNLDEWVPSSDEVLGSGELPTPEQDTSPVQLNVPAGWEKLLVDAAVIGGADRWRRRLKGLGEEFRLHLRAAWLENEGERLRIQRRLEQLQNLERFALPLIDQLSAWPKQALWRRWLDRLADLAQSALRWPESVLSTLTDLAPMEEVGPVGIDEVYGVLSERLRFFKREPDGRRFGSVFVCSIEEGWARQFPVVFLPGLAEGLFPRRTLENPLLLDRYRRELSSSLELQDDRAAWERKLLITAIAVATDQLIVSYPSMDTALSRPRVPSFYALEVLRAVEGRLPDLATFQKQSAAAAQTRLSWPAPADPEVAIDDAEYDLACLKLGTRVRYLLDTNENLRRSLKARRARWREPWNEWDALVRLDGDALKVLHHHRPRERAYSPSALQNFAQCPYRFALQSIFGLRPREDAEALEQMDPLTRGELFHATQFKIFRDLKAKGFLPVLPDRLSTVFDISDQVLDRVAAEFEERLAPAIKRVWSTEIDDLRTDLRAWLRDVAEQEAGWLPVHFEFGFGLSRGGSHDAASVPEPATILDGFPVHGSIDLVEAHTTGKLRVVDHKTGKALGDTAVSVGGGILLQPLVYALAVEAIFGREVESGRLYFCTQRGGYSRLDIPVTDAGRQRLGYVFKTIDKAIDEGFLPAAPVEGACQRCDYTAVCGPYEEERIGRKYRPALESLETLRSLP